MKTILTVIGAMLFALAVAVVVMIAVAPKGETEAGIICESFVKAALKSPASADFPILPQSVVRKGRTQTFTVVSYVDSQNAFGAKIRTRWSCTVTHNGGDWSSLRSWTLGELTLD